jgi:probable DNA metabolism protein
VEVVQVEQDFESWRGGCLDLLRRGVPPSEVSWQGPHEPQRSLFEGHEPGRTSLSCGALGVNAPHVSREFVRVSRAVIHHSAPERWGLCYRVLWRLTHDEPRVMQQATDPDIMVLHKMYREVSRDRHKMKAFVRFKRVEDAAGEEHFVAWHRPDHYIVPLVAPFFADRFAGMRWTIMTPHESVSWDGEALHFGGGVTRREAGDIDDELEDVWKTYYRAIFNPARIKLKAMRAEMPMKHWPTMPETAVITDMLRESPERIAKMLRQQVPTATAWVPDDPEGLPEIERAMRRCGACELCGLCQGAVMGEGSAQARVVIIGEQPGDREDQRGRPWVGPAGELLDRALHAARLPRESCYLTNALKAFKHTERTPGRRVHSSPVPGDITTCKPWLEAELAQVSPCVVVALGRSAGFALLGRKVVMRHDRGEHRTRFAQTTLLSWHPAGILRSKDSGVVASRFDELVADLSRARELCEEEA